MPPGYEMQLAPVKSSPPLALSPKGVRRARTMLYGSEAQDPWWCGCASF